MSHPVLANPPITLALLAIVAAVIAAFADVSLVIGGITYTGGT